jgi:hypothetical protein
MNRTLYQVAMVGAVVIYTMTHLPWSDHPAKPDNGFEFSVAKQKDDAKQAQWLVKMSAGTFTMNFSWNP